MQLGEEEVIAVDALVVDADVLVVLDGGLSVGNGFLIVAEFLLADGQINEGVDKADVDDIILADADAHSQHLFCPLEVLHLIQVVPIFE